VIGGRRHPRTRQELRIMLDEKLGLEAEMLGVVADHLERLEPRWQARQIALLDRFEVIGMNAGGLARCLDAPPAFLTLTLEIPSGFTSRVELTIRPWSEERGRTRLPAGVLDEIGVGSVHDTLFWGRGALTGRLRCPSH